MPHVRCLSFFVLLHGICLLGHAQDPTKSLERDQWRARADTLTNNLLRDAAKTDALDRALLIAQLSDSWWESEQTQANTWIEKSVDTIVFYPSAEAKQQRAKYLDTAREVLALIFTRNRKQASRLTDILSKPEEDVPDNERQFNSEALITQALGIVKTNPAAATKLALRAFSLRFPTNAWKLALELRRNNPNLANQIFSAAFSTLSTAPDTQKMHAMIRIAFPDLDNSDFPPKLLPPRELRISFLNFVADYLYQRQLKFSSKAIPSCSNEATLAGKLRTYFSEWLPLKSEMVEHSVNICVSKQTKQLLNRFDAATNDVDELLKEADRIEGEPVVRANFLIRAALAALVQNKFATAIEILEKMTDDERKVAGDFWDEIRVVSAARLAVVEFKEGDIAGANKTLRKLSDARRPLGQIGFVYQFSPEDEACYQFCVDLLNESRAGITKSELPFPKKTSEWLTLVKLYSRYKLQTEAAEVFKEMVIAFNSSKLDDDTALNHLISESKRIVPDFALSLFETNEDRMVEAVSLISDQKVRRELNLQFLKVMLEKYRLLKVELEKKAATTRHIE